jgi:hypothetical protein
MRSFRTSRVGGALGLAAATLATASTVGFSPPAAANPIIATEQGLIATIGQQYTNCQPDLSCTGPDQISTALLESSRDCGYSVPVAGTQRLWIFCDAEFFQRANPGDTPAKIGNFITSSAGLATSAAPTEVNTTLVDQNPWQLLDVTPNGQCDPTYPNSYYAAWPQSATTLTGLTNTGGKEIVAVMFQQTCVRPNSFNPVQPPFEGRETGIAIIEFDGTGSQAVPPQATYGWFGIRGTVLNGALFENTPNTYGFQFGLSQHTDASGTHLYVTRCEQLIRCDAARVALNSDWNGVAKTAIGTTANWQFQTPSGTWSPFDPVTKAPTGPTKALWSSGSNPADNPSIVWNANVGRYVMLYAREGFTEKAAVRTALNPAGPWSAPVDIELPANCLQIASSAVPYNGCYQMIAQPQLDSSGSLAFSYFDVNDLLVTGGGAPAIGRMHWATIPSSALPSPVTAPPVTLSFASGVSSVATPALSASVPGTTDADATVTVTINGGAPQSAAVSAAGAFSIPVAGAAGSYSVVATACRQTACSTSTANVVLGSAAKVSPILECVASIRGTHIARWGHNNTTGTAILVPVGTNNRFNPAPQDRGQVTLFLTGRRQNTFQTPIPPTGNTVWNVTGRTATANSSSKVCTS